MNDLLALVCLAAGLAALYAFWHSSLAARETANRLAKQACERAGVQFLDGTAAFARLSRGRDRSGKRRWLRTYTFDYSSDGSGRAQGFVVLAGEQLLSLGLADQLQ